MIKDLYKKNISILKEKYVTALALIAGLASYSALLINGWGHYSSDSFFIFSDTIFYLFLSYVGFCCLLHMICRLGYLRRIERHNPASEEKVEAYLLHRQPKFTFLIPSYKEETAVIRQTLYSAALQDYPNRGIVLLIDDPSSPKSPEDRQLLERARALPGEVMAVVASKRGRMASAQMEFRGRLACGVVDLEEEGEKLALIHEELAAWFLKIKMGFPNDSHTDRCFHKETFDPRIDKHRRRSREARQGVWTLERIEVEYNYLTGLFTVDVTSFERKRYDNLSHASNKAMNINSYLSLVGKRFEFREKDDVALIIECDKESADLQVPESPYIGVLDADSFVKHDYASRLIFFMEQEENSHAAVVQSPYSSIPGAPGQLERIAGATTDMQYIIHQGYTSFDATFWVGANAVIRKKALEEVAETHFERGFPIIKYIQDRTEIEDTETTIDLVCKGWSLHNYPERLAFSATPADFGSLLIQRRRWLNGGLLVLPKLFKYTFSRPWTSKKFIEFIIRFQYLASLVVIFGFFLVMGFLRLQQTHYIAIWTLILSLPSFVIYTRDLKLAGFKAVDLLRVMALNFVLYPVHVAGTLKSIQQAITGKQTPFCRTPKVIDRTSVPPLYVIVETAMTGSIVLGFAYALFLSEWSSAHFTNMILNLPMIYGYLVFLGLQNCFTDIRPLYRRFSLPMRKKTAAVEKDDPMPSNAF